MFYQSPSVIPAHTPGTYDTSRAPHLRVSLVVYSASYFAGAANSSVKRCRIVKDRIRLWKQGVRDLVMELCCALHNFRVRLTPWQPMI